MTTPHSDVAAELWSLAETVLTRMEPLLRQAVQKQDESPRQGCSWCPVCALAALIRGEQHDLVTLLASEGSTVIALLRQLVSEHVERADPAEHAAQTGHSTPADSSASTESSTTPDAPVGGSVGDDPSGAQNDGDHAADPVIRRAAFEPITVTVKDSTTSGPQD